MTARPIVMHLVDDTTAGGVMRVVDFIENSAVMAAEADHQVMQITRGKLSARQIKADVIVSHLAISWRSLPAIIMLRAANAGIPCVHIEHSYTAGFVAHNVRNRARFTTLLKVAFSLFDRIVAVSNGQANWISARGLCLPEKLTVIRSCVDLAPFRALPTENGPVRVFGAIGRLDTQKGFDTLILSFRTMLAPDLRLRFYGQGDQETALRALAGSDTRISFHGFAGDPCAAYAAVDAVIMPSRWEAYGLVAVEALCAGKSVICTEIDGMTDHKAGGADTIPCGAVGALAEKMRNLAHLDAGPRSLSPYRNSDVLERDFCAGWSDLVKQLLNATNAIPAAACNTTVSV